ncbi:MAG: ABC transporter ATP-binding protein [Elusimicrobia bacterium]|nr:ABC transporter ATP-binding protein [Elusimicrobiota bacterium]
MPLIIETDSLRREFGETTAVDELSLSVEEGSVLALVGPNGAGKTTLLRMLSALLEPTSGTARVDGFDVRERPREVHSRLGFMPDFAGLYENLLVREYLRYFCLAYRLPEDLSEMRVSETLSLVGLSARAEQAVETLSRGMRQKLNLARTLLHSPKLLLLDEPAAGLDPGARREVQLLMRELSRQGKTIVVSSHILSELEDYCTHVAILDRGRLIFSGSLEEARRILGKKRHMRLRAASGMEAALALLQARPEVRKAQRSGADILFELAGNDADAASILKALVEKGVSVSFFGEAAGTIQDSYLSLMGEER